jgi:hypothetical protein
MIYVFGGIKSTSGQECLSSIECINAQALVEGAVAQRWVEVEGTDRCISARKGSLMAPLPSENKIIVLGGTDPQDRYLSDGLELDLTTNRFNRVDCCLPQSNEGFQVVRNQS